MSGGLAGQIQKVDHIGVLVPDVAEAVPLVRDLLGARFLSGGDNPTTGVRLVHFALPGLKVELLAPLRADSLVSRPPGGGTSPPSTTTSTTCSPAGWSGGTVCHA
jgi:catechol 2,3-dioxygenase-like lactoylglutathione lyase family enzyme